MKVSVISFGAGHIGSPEMDDKAANRLLNNILDSGINLIDTARSYGESERRIAQFLSHRRHEYILSTKVGYTFSDQPDWSYNAVMGTVDEALMKLQTDYLDIVHLHSCDLWFLEQGDAILALDKAREQGKIRVMAYSGENDALAYAIGSNRFGSIQCSVNIFDQHSSIHHLPEAKEKGLGIIAKRPLGNSVWRYTDRPDGHGHAVYWDRFKQMEIKSPEYGWNELALRFTAFNPYVDTIIAGTSNTDHLEENIRLVEKGPLPRELSSRITAAFLENGMNWDGLI